MPTTSVHTDWVGDQLFLLHDRSDFPIVMAQPQGVNAADLLPLSLIGCLAWDVISILRKQRQQVTGLHVEAESEQDPEPPWRLRKIRIRYTITGMDLKEQAVDHALSLSETKYCSIYATLRAAVELVTEYRLVQQ